MIYIVVTYIIVFVVNRECIARDALILPAKVLEKDIGKSKRQNAGKKWKIGSGHQGMKLGTFSMKKIEIL